EQWWQCQTPGCSWWNTGNAKRCKCCGLKKSWAQVVGQDASNARAPSKLQAVELLLQGGASNADARVDVPKPSTTPAAPHSTEDKGAQIKQLENSLAAIPPGSEFDDLRASLQSKIAALKRSMTMSKPLSSQLVSCRAAVDRAQRRKALCEEALAKAKAALDEATKESITKATELKELEEKAMQVSMPNSLEASTQALTRVIADMKASPAIPQVHLAQAEQEIMKVLTGLQAIATAASATAAQNAAMATAVPPDTAMPTSDEQAIKRRLRGKQNNPNASPDVEEVFQEEKVAE
ncbi:unnamed protein product, partial [Prorocentrum cordatum]